jgi:hypothetical protein
MTAIISSEKWQNLSNLVVTDRCRLKMQISKGGSDGMVLVK